MATEIVIIIQIFTLFVLRTTLYIVHCAATCTTVNTLLGQLAVSIDSPHLRSAIGKNYDSNYYMKRRRGDNNFINAINSISEADITK